MEATYDVFVPGRLCILGEHTDWAGGYRSSDSSLSIGRTVVCCTNEGLYASCRRYKPQLCHYSTDRHVESFDEPLTESILSSIAATGEFYSYVAGTLLGILIHETYGPLLRTNGLSISNYRTDLPMKKGLSSSAAICVLVVRCFAAAYQIHISIEEVMSLAYDGEMRTPSRCGRMDQCVALGAGGLALMEFTGDTRRPCHITPLTTPKPLYLVVADLNAGKDTVTILRTLNSCYPKPANDTQVDRDIPPYSYRLFICGSAACFSIRIRMWNSCLLLVQRYPLEMCVSLALQ